MLTRTDLGLHYPTPKHYLCWTSTGDVNEVEIKTLFYPLVVPRDLSLAQVGTRRGVGYYAKPEGGRGVPSSAPRE
eukprot:751410-Hanusia_phi.AAC.2